MVSKFYFNLKEAAIFRAVKWEKVPVFSSAKSLKKLFLILFIIVFLLFLFQVLSEKPHQDYLALSIIFLALTIIFRLADSFFNLKLKKPVLGKNIVEQAGFLDEAVKNPEKYNLAEFLSLEVARAFDKSLKFQKSKKLSEINSSILFYFLLIDNPKLNFVFSRAILDFNEIIKTFKQHINEIKPEKELKSEDIYSKDFQNSIIGALKIAQKKGHIRIELGDAISSLAKEDLIFKKILVEFNLKAEDFENLNLWLEYLEEKPKRRKKFWDYESLLKRGTMAKEWTAGYTITLDQYAIDWTERVKRALPEFIGHKDSLKAVERILSRREINNVLIVGGPGSGRKSIIYALALKSLFGQSLPEVNYKRVVELDLPGIISQMRGEEAEITLDKIFQETISAGNIILVIDEFHNYVSQVPRPGILDISGVLSSYLHLPKFQLVAITTFEGLHKNIEQNSSMLALFEKVEVSEISPQETLLLLENLTLVLERKYKKFISYPALREIITLTERYLPSLPFPEKAMDILDEVVIYVADSTRDPIVLPKHVDKIISEKTQIPVGEIEAKEKNILLNLEDLIHQRIINQEEAVNEVSSAMRRARTGVTIRKGPMGCFLFLGPTGVGKTETSKALAEIYFGSEEKMIRLDMSEFQNTTDIPRLIGAAGEEGMLTTKVRESPFSLVLLDEIEKAHPNILNLFLQVLDEGNLTDGLGRKVDFKSTIIIATSNAAYKVILKALKEKTEWSKVKQKLLENLFAEGIFRPEFINRFDAMVVFRPLTKENLLDIAELFLQKLKKNLQEKEVEFLITPELKEKIVELGYDPTFGAREMRRVIQDRVENILASALLSDRLKRGYRVKVDPEKFELIINP
jgi:ATP-dependent Clp protease ATP-binding subunit ClpC